MKSRLIFVLFILYSINVSADEWSLFSQHGEMKDFMIAEVGEVSKVEPPFNTVWNQDVYQMNGRCFLFSGYMGYWGYGDKSALILINSAKIIKLAIIEAEIGSIKVDLKGITMIDCPSSSNMVPYSSDPKEMLRLLKEKQLELKKQLEQLNSR